MAYCLLSNHIKPCSFDKTIKSEDWKYAIESELKSHEEHGTREPAKLPIGQKSMDLN